MDQIKVLLQSSKPEITIEDLHIDLKLSQEGGKPWPPGRVGFVAFLKGAKIAEGVYDSDLNHLLGDPFLVYYQMNIQELVSSIYLLAGTTCIPAPYPKFPEKIDEVSLTKYVKDFISAKTGVPLKSRIESLNERFRFQPDQYSHKVEGHLYQIHILAVEIPIFSCKLIKRRENVFVQTSRDTMLDFVKVTLKILRSIPEHKSFYLFEENHLEKNHRWKLFIEHELNPLQVANRLALEDPLNPV